MEFQKFKIAILALLIKYEFPDLKDEDFNKRVQEMKLDFGSPSELEQQIESKENKKRTNSEISIISRKELLKLIKNNKN